MAATDQTVQSISDGQVRPICEAIRSLVIALENFKAQFGDSYAYLTGAGSGWVDARTDAPPHTATANDLLAFNAAVQGGSNILDAIKSNGNYTVLQSLCVRTPPL